MARNVKLQVLRGVLANMPALNPGELYVTTDTGELYMGAPGNVRAGISSIRGVGNGGTKGINAPQRGTGAGPTNPLSVVSFAQVNIAGSVFWIPLMV